MISGCIGRWQNDGGSSLRFSKGLVKIKYLPTLRVKLKRLFMTHNFFCNGTDHCIWHTCYGAMDLVPSGTFIYGADLV